MPNFLLLMLPILLSCCSPLLLLVIADEESSTNATNSNSDSPSSSSPAATVVPKNGTHRNPIFGCSNFCFECVASRGRCDSNGQCCEADGNYGLKEAEQMLEEMLEFAEQQHARQSKKNGTESEEKASTDPADPIVCRQFCAHCLNATNGICDLNDRCCVSSDTQLERDFEQLFLGEQNNNNQSATDQQE